MSRRQSPASLSHSGCGRGRRHELRCDARASRLSLTVIVSLRQTDHESANRRVRLSHESDSCLSCTGVGLGRSPEPSHRAGAPGVAMPAGPK